jgi:hypothetical protein
MHSPESIFTPSDTQLCHKYVKIRNLCQKTQAAFWSAFWSLFLNKPWDNSLPWGLVAYYSHLLSSKACSKTAAHYCTIFWLEYSSSK